MLPVVTALRRWSLVLAAMVPVLPAGADVFHLQGGGRIEGQLVEVEERNYRIRTTVGIVRMPLTSVLRIEPGPTPFDEYDRRAADAETAGTADAQVALAEWCGEQGLKAERRKHLQRAVELNPDHAAARHGLGQVRVGEAWVDGRSGGAKKAPAGEEKENDPARLARAMQAQWLRTVRVYKESLLEGRLAGQFDQGREKILAIRDPLAIFPLVEVLGRGEVRVRNVLVEALGAFAEDEATMNLAFIALMDPEESLRQAALAQLARRDDPTIVAQYRKALQQANELVRRRAAFALGELKAAEAVPDLIEALTTVRSMMIEVPMRDYFEVWPRVFHHGAGSSYRLGGRTVTLGEPWRLAEDYWGGGYYIFADQTVNVWTPRVVTVYRTEALEALRRITGRDFGFERDAWQAWYAEENKPPSEKG